MKEASGEASMTVITIILIGVISAIAIPLVNSAMSSTAKKAVCQNLGGTLSGDVCKYYENGASTQCTITETNGAYTCSGS